jgi:hypothetical protein
MQQQYVPTIPYVELVYVLCIASGFGREVASRPSYTEQGTTSLIFLVGITGFPATYPKRNPSTSLMNQRDDLRSTNYCNRASGFGKRAFPLPHPGTGQAERSLFWHSWFSSLGHYSLLLSSPVGVGS